MLKSIDSFSMPPNNKLLLYYRYVLSKLFWHLTATSLSKTWVIEHLDSVVARFVNKSLKLLLSFTFSGIILPYNYFGLNLQLPSTKFFQCQNALRSALLYSSCDTIHLLWNIVTVVQMYNMILITILNRF